MNAASRREFLAAALLSPVLARLQPPAGRLVSIVPFLARTAPLDRLLGDGLDARRFTDLSTLPASAGERPTTPTDRFFVRTATPRVLRNRRPETWSIALDGPRGLEPSASDGARRLQPSAPRGLQPSDTIDLATLRRLSRPAGRHLMECAGNGDAAGYGLMSAADWEGVPLDAVLERIPAPSTPHRVLVSGVDDEESPGGTSVPGASWIFARSDLRRAFLALRMNGADLPPDHGGPVRLLVPDWYGCACIKWVDRIDLVPDDSAPTTQMVEYAARTHQAGQPARAREYEPATIDTAAMPVRVEQWRAGDAVSYRVIGVVWGGTTPTNALEIRFKSGGAWAPVERCPLPATTEIWSVWTHTWRPEAPGRYDIALRVADRSIRTRRLDLFFYVRSVMIDTAP